MTITRGERTLGNVSQKYNIELSIYFTRLRNHVNIFQKLLSWAIKMYNKVLMNLSH